MLFKKSPMAGYLSCKFGLEKVILIGCTLSSLAMGFCFFAENILTVVLCWGLLSGIGFGMCVTLVYAAVSHNFTRNVTTANGVVVSGASIGAILYLPICKMSIDKFGLSGTFLVLPALTLNAIPAAMVLWFSRSDKNKTDRKVDIETSATYSDQKISQVQNMEIHSADTLCSGKSFAIAEEIQITSSSKFIAKDPAMSSQEQDSLLQSRHSTIHIKESSEMRLDRICKSAGMVVSLTSISLRVNDTSEKSIAKNKLSLTEVFEENAAEKDPEICLRSLKNIKQEKHISQNVTDSTCVDQATIEQSENVHDKMSDERENCESAHSNWSKFNILYDPLFLLLSFIQSTYIGTITMQLTTVAEYVLDKGFQTTDAAFLLMCSFPMDIGGRLVLGWVTDYGFMSVPNFCALLFFCYGMCFVVFVLCTEMIGLTVTYALLTFFTGAIMALFPTLVSLNFERDRKTMALSSGCFLYVPISFCISPLIGYMRGTLGSYDEMYYLLAGICVLCTLLIFFIPSVRECSRKMCFKP